MNSGPGVVAAISYPLGVITGRVTMELEAECLAPGMEFNQFHGITKCSLDQVVILFQKTVERLPYMPKTSE